MTRELIVDSFAGGGGASEGIERALGRAPDIAINHDEEALALHAANHPDTLHLPHNVWKVDPLDVTKGRPVGLLWASPDCKHFSKAKGGKPVKRNIRDLAWVVVRWARQVRPRVIILENVEEFRTWGPVDADGQPCPERRGQTFDRWIGELRRLGYRVEHRELRACDFGAPTIRKRLFLIARRDGRKIVWPQPTHGDPASEAVKAGRLMPWRTAAEIIDWSLPCHSIFLTREEGRAVGVNRPLAEKTMARIAKGVKRYVLDNPRPFIVPVTHAGDERVHGIGEPVRTITTAQRGEHALVTPFVARTDMHQSNAGCVFEPEAPLRTVTTGGGHAVVAPHIMTMRNAGKPFNGADEPTHTVTAGGAGLSLVSPLLVSTAHGDGQRRGKGDYGPEEPLGTVVGSNDRAAVAVHLQRQFGGSVGSDAGEPVGSIMPGGGGKTALVAATIVKNNFGDKPCSGAEEPVHTVTTQGNRFGVVAAFLAQHNGGWNERTGHDARAPVSTITQSGANQAVVSAGLVSLKGSDRRSSPVEEPARTVLAGGGHAAEVRAFLVKYFGSDQDPRLAEPLHTVTTKERHGLVTVEIAGEPYVVADIGMRMLTPRELFRAQGFGDDYVIDRGRFANGWRALTKTAQVRMCGNSVCPPLAEALVAANYRADEAALRRPTRPKPDLPLIAAE